MRNLVYVYTFTIIFLVKVLKADYLLPHWNPTSFNCLFPACRACDYVYIDYVRRSRSSSCRLLRPINCQTYITSPYTMPERGYLSHWCQWPLDLTWLKWVTLTFHYYELIMSFIIQDITKWICRFTLPTANTRTYNLRQRSYNRTLVCCKDQFINWERLHSQNVVQTHLLTDLFL